MSQTATPTTPAPDVPVFTKESGQEFMEREVFLPYFFHKLAGHGLVPENEEEANTLVRMGAKLLNASDLDQTKQASSRLSFLKSADQRLDSSLQRSHGVQAPSAQNTAIAKDAEALAQHPALRAAVLASRG